MAVQWLPSYKGIQGKEAVTCNKLGQDKHMRNNLSQLYWELDRVWCEPNRAIRNNKNIIRFIL